MTKRNSGHSSSAGSPEDLAATAAAETPVDEWWTAGGGYSFASQRVKGIPDNASANTVYLSISYNWPKISIAR